jgi:hypothetical protein
VSSQHETCFIRATGFHEEPKIMTNDSPDLPFCSSGNLLRGSCCCASCLQCWQHCRHALLRIHCHLQLGSQQGVARLPLRHPLLQQQARSWMPLCPPCPRWVPYQSLGGWVGGWVGAPVGAWVCAADTCCPATPEVESLLLCS